MQVTARRAVSPVIATLLLIAIAVAASIIVYVYVNSLSSGLTTGGGQQMSEQVSMDAYNYGTIGSGVLITVRDTGSGSVTIGSIFFDGLVPTTINGEAPATCADGAYSLAAGSTCKFTLTGMSAITSATSGTSHSIKIISATGGTTVFSVIAGRSG
jgi:flagellin-like protein